MFAATIAVLVSSILGVTIAGFLISKTTGFFSLGVSRKAVVFFKADESMVNAFFATTRFGFIPGNTLDTLDTFFSETDFLFLGTDVFFEDDRNKWDISSKPFPSFLTAEVFIVLTLAGVVVFFILAGFLTGLAASVFFSLFFFLSMIVFGRKGCNYSRLGLNHTFKKYYIYGIMSRRLFYPLIGPDREIPDNNLFPQ
ncbi:MAG: hypothetical protein PHO30_00315 [Candidatus Omnitrophica bacterium]|nr:hypothetical protein [Candidatus Omnitrophota bacterium]